MGCSAPESMTLDPTQQARLAELERDGPEIARRYLAQLAVPPLSRLPPRAQAELAQLAFGMPGEAMNALAASAGRGFSGEVAARALLLFARTSPAERPLVTALLRRETTSPGLIDALVRLSAGAQPQTLGSLLRDLVRPVG